MTRITKEAMTLSDRRLGLKPDPACSGRLTWVHTEFGRRTVDGDYRVVGIRGAWELLDREWTELCPRPFVSVIEAQQEAERIERRRR